MAFSQEANGLGPKVAEPFERNLREFAARKITHDQMDCSRYPYEAIVIAAKQAGEPVQRVPVRYIMQGAGGWSGFNYYELRDRSHLSVAAFTWANKTDRWHHMGILLLGPSGWELAHSPSGQRAICIVPWSEYWTHYSDGFRYLTIGE
jgi:hypothetical protein